MRKKYITQTDILFLSISFFMIVFLWIGFNLYHAYATSTISKDLQMQIVPIAPKFDTATLDKLKTRQQIVPLLELDTTQQASSAAQNNTEDVQNPDVTLSPTEIPSSTGD